MLQRKQSRRAPRPYFGRWLLAIGIFFAFAATVSGLNRLICVLWESNCCG